MAGKYLDDGKNYKNTSPSRRVVPKPCPRCGKLFKPLINRGKRQVYCSMECRKRPAKTIKCEICGERFEGKLTNGIWPKYCSIDCSNAGKRDYVERVCTNCGVKFTRPRHKANRAKHKREYCSKSCHYEHSRGDQSPEFRGGVCKPSHGVVLISQGQHKWRLEHRLAVEELIGRKLEYRGEPILHINGRNDDNRIENLYVCKNYSEMITILKSSDAPYPVTSNVKALAKESKRKD